MEKHGEGVFVICVFETGNNQINQFNSSCEHHSIVITSNYISKKFDSLSIICSLSHKFCDGISLKKNKNE